MKFSFKLYHWPLKRLKNGKRRLPAKNAFKWFTEPHRTVHVEYSGEYQPIKLTKFEATDNQIKTWLYRMSGYEFKTYTDKGTVKVDREELETIGELGEDLVRLIKVKKDISQLGGTDNSLISQFNPTTHCIHGRIDTIGAATHRCLPLSYKIDTPSGPKSFDELEVGDYVWTYSIELKEYVLSPLEDKFMYNGAMTYRLFYGLQHFDCTLNHKWLTDEGLVETKDLSKESTLILKGNQHA